MFEVEVRGRLTQEGFNRLKLHLEQQGAHVESHVREMIRLYDYPGFDEDTVKREVDIRLRDTDGRCEIMVKHKASHDNTVRHELSLRLVDTNLDNAKAVVKALGYSKGLWMHRKKDIFTMRGFEWSLVEAPKNFYYFEVEKEAGDTSEAATIEAELREEAQSLGLTLFSSDEYRKFIKELSDSVNRVIEW